MSIPSDHRPSVILDADGRVVPTLGSINVASAGTKLRRVLPEHNERIVSIQDNKDYFKNLRFVNLLLTNACNLSCTYCYEQHNRDFGRFNLERLDEVWTWFKGINPHAKKTLSFFGGEPLIHKNLILDFLESKREAMQADEASRNVTFGLTTNGLLLSQNFIDHYFSFYNTIMMVSLDTIRPELDHRQISTEQLSGLLDMIEYATKKAEIPTRFAVRATISREGAPYVKEFWEELYRRGVRQLVFHPLILSQESGYIEWPEDEWEKFSNDLKSIILEYPDVKYLRFAEGVGMKMETNCLTGSDTIAVDPSGDFSGCYFFTNRKQQIGKMLIGNIFEDALYVDRYTEFHRQYEAMFENDVCRSCNYKNVCYQCPAGNISTGDALFRPDGMCWRFAKLHNEFHDLVIRKHFTDKVKDLVSYRAKDGDMALVADTIALMFKFATGYYKFNDDVRAMLPPDIDYRKCIGLLYEMVEGRHLHGRDYKELHLDDILQHVQECKAMTPKEAYTAVRNLVGQPVKEVKLTGEMEEVTYQAMLHLAVVDASHPKGALNEKAGSSSASL